MSNNLIQITRSSTNTIPVSLANGQLAYTSNGDVLYIGSPNGSIVAIGGARFPGTLTANQALVANTTSWINLIQAATVNALAVYLGAPGTPGVGAAGQVVTSNGTVAYWGSPASGVNAQAQYTFTNNITFNANVYVANSTLFVGNSTSNVALGNTATSPIIYIGNATVNTTVNSTAFSGTANNATNLNGQNAAFYTNATNITTGTLPAAQLPASVVNTSGNFTVAGNLNFTGTNNYFVGVYVGANVVVNTTSHFVGNATVNTNITAGSISLSGVTVNSTSYGGTSANATNLNSQPGSFYTNATNITTGILPWAQAPAGTVNTTGSFTLTGNTILNGTNTNIGSNVYVSGAVTTFTGNVNVTGGTLLTNNVIVTGNLTVTGTTVTVNNTIMMVNTNFIELADNNNTTDVLDIGFYGKVGNSTASWYTGMYRDATASETTGGIANPVFKLFAANVQPSSTVNTTASYTLGILQAYLQPYGSSGAFVVNSTAVAATANSAVSVNITANTITVPTGITATSGGTGQNTYAVGDLLVGAATNTLTKVTLGTSGYVLQSNGTTVVYGTLDGGSF